MDAKEGSQMFSRPAELFGPIIRWWKSQGTGGMRQIRWKTMYFKGLCTSLRYCSNAFFPWYTAKITKNHRFAFVQFVYKGERKLRAVNLMQGNRKCLFDQPVFLAGGLRIWWISELREGSVFYGEWKIQSTIQNDLII